MSPSTAATTDLAHDLRLALMRLARRLRQQRADHGLGMGQLSALATLERCGPMTAGALASHEQVRPPSMTKTLAALDAAGYVVRTPDPDDGRQVVVALAPSARKLLAELEPEQRAALHAALPVLEVLADS